VRASEAALRYGRFYFRPISGDGVNFGISGFSPGVLAFSRILNDAEVVVIANTSKAPGPGAQLHVIVDLSLNPVGKQMKVLFSNKPHATAPTPATEHAGVMVREVDGTVGTGPVRAIRVTLLPTEVQILR
jgi:hypothetical protein